MRPRTALLLAALATLILVTATVQLLIAVG